MRFILLVILCAPFSEIARRFPSLEILDQEAIVKIAFDTPLASTSTAGQKSTAVTSFPAEMMPSFVTGVDGNLISSFLMRFVLFSLTLLAILNTLLLFVDSSLYTTISALLL